MKRYDYWIMNAKLNMVGFGIPALFMTFIGIGISR